MRIAEAVVQQSSAHQLTREYQRHESTIAWVGEAPEGLLPGPPRPAAADADGDPAALVKISPEARRLLTENCAQSCPEGELLPEDPEISKLRMLLEMITGRKIRVTGFQPVSRAEVPAPAPAAGENSGPPLQGWGLAYDLYEREATSEQLTYQASGQVRTADGRTIDFSLALALSRETVREQHISIRAGDATLIDPLVINLAGNSATLDGVKFSFDLDLNGQTEELNFVGAGSGFLALDRNGDGIINDGNELFGPRTNNGLAELTAFDLDGNGWIDENDPIYDQLRIWVKENGNDDRLYSLREKGIGAIFLNGTSTPFTLTGPDATSLGQLRETTIYLREDGRPGAIQEVDYLV